MALTEQDFERLESLLRDRHSVCPHIPDSSEHTQHHEVLERWIANDIAKKERNEKIKSTVIAGGLLAALGGVGTGAVNLVQYIQDHWK